MKKLLYDYITKLSTLLPDESIQNSKKKWNVLADENPLYYIVSKDGQNITEDQFRKAGEENYKVLIKGDPLLKDVLSYSKNKRALDIGCGVGRLTEFFAGDFGQADGIDISEKMVEQAKKRLSAIDNVNFTATDGVQYPFEDNSIDLVFSYVVFQHMPSIDVVKKNFEEIKRVLKNDGIAKIQVRGGLSVRKGSWFYGPSFKEEDMENMMKDVGLQIVKQGDDSVKRYFLWLKK